MKIQYCSDLHLELEENKKFLDKNPIRPEGEILLLAGDILPLALNPLKCDFFNRVADDFEAVYWVPGNHEYYGSDIGKATSPLHEKIRSNVFLTNNTTIVRKDVHIICTTLWSYINPVDGWMLQKNLADFFAIAMNELPFLPTHFNALHETAVSFLKDEVNRLHASRKVVASHHVPTFLRYPTKYKKSLLSQAFAVELHDFILQSGISYWLYGHHHSNTPAFNIGNTTLLTNQLGYVRKYEHRSYQRCACFEI